MEQPPEPHFRTREELRAALAALSRSAPPAIARFAVWALENPEDIAFYALRTVAERAGVNANTVYRFSVALGYPGFDACKRNFQAILVDRSDSYSARARKLSDRTDVDLIEGIRSATNRNVDSVLANAQVAAIEEAAALLRGARQAMCMGVRSSFALAHYFAYTGSMAFANFQRPIVEAGSITDVMSHASPDDVAVLISFSLYSSEIIRAHKIAVDRGVRIIAITDTVAAPIADQARLVFTLPMQGPQTLPSFTAGFALVEAIVNVMIAADSDAPNRVESFENQLASHGAYGAGM